MINSNKTISRFTLICSVLALVLSVVAILDVPSYNGTSQNPHVKSKPINLVSINAMTIDALRVVAIIEPMYGFPEPKILTLRHEVREIVSHFSADQRSLIEEKLNNSLLIKSANIYFNEIVRRN